MKAKRGLVVGEKCNKRRRDWHEKKSSEKGSKPKRVDQRFGMEVVRMEGGDRQGG